MAVRLLDYAFGGNLRKVKRCINNGVDVNAFESSGNSALYHAEQKSMKVREISFELWSRPKQVNLCNF